MPTGKKTSPITAQECKTLVDWHVHIEENAPAPKDVQIRPIANTEQQKDFSTIRQGNATNVLTKLRAVAGKTATIDAITGDATITKGNFTLKIPNYASLTGLKTSTYQLLDAITIALTESGAKSPTVELSLSDYMERRGLKDRKEARRQIVGDLGVLLKASLTWEEKRGKTSIPYAAVNITDSWMWGDSKKSTIIYTFGSTFYKALLGYPIMPYPAQLQTLNSRQNPNSYYLLRKLAEHKNMNVGKKNENLISVKTLLGVAPFIPSYKEVMAGNRNTTARIIEPFERDMEALEETLSFEYCHSSGTPLDATELKNISYDLFITLLIRTHWKRYPDQTARLEKKMIKMEKAKGRKTTKKKIDKAE